jgi:hypothetical protein
MNTHFISASTIVPCMRRHERTVQENGTDGVLLDLPRNGSPDVVDFVSAVRDIAIV